MAVISELKALFDEWIAAVAGTVESVTCRLVRRRQILLSEAADNTFTARLASARNGPALPDVSFRLSRGRPSPSLPADWEAAVRGSRVEILLTSGQVLFRSLDFPKQAGDVLDGRIRAQIDRLTPWSAEYLGFCWGPAANNCSAGSRNAARRCASTRMPAADRP